MIVSVTVIWVMLFVIGVMLAYYEKQKLGATLMLLSLPGLSVFVVLGFEIGFMESFKILVLSVIDC